MSPNRFGAILVPAIIAALLAAIPAAAKDGVAATLVSKIARHTPPGTRLRIAWRLTYLDARGRPHAFGASKVFVRLCGAAGARRTTAFAATVTKPTAVYVARVVVPNGGVRGIQIGLRSWTSGPSGTRRSDWLFPIRNVPEWAARRC